MSASDEMSLYLPTGSACKVWIENTFDEDEAGDYREVWIARAQVGPVEDILREQCDTREEAVMAISELLFAMKVPASIIGADEEAV